MNTHNSFSFSWFQRGLACMGAGWCLLQPLARAHVTEPPDLTHTGIVIEGVGNTFRFTLSDQGTCAALISATVLDSAIADITPAGPIEAVSVEFTVTATQIGETQIRLSWIGVDFPNPPCNELVDNFRIPIAVIEPGAERPRLEPQNSRVGSRTRMRLPTDVTVIHLPPGAIFEGGIFDFQPGAHQTGFQTARFQSSAGEPLDLLLAVSPFEAFRLDLSPDGQKLLRSGGISGPGTIERANDMNEWNSFSVTFDTWDSFPMRTEGEAAGFFRARQGLPPLLLNSEPVLFIQPLPNGYSDQTILHLDFNPGNDPAGLQFETQVPLQENTFRIMVSPEQYPDDGTFFFYFSDEKQVGSLYSQALRHIPSTPPNTLPTISAVQSVAVPVDGSATTQFVVSDPETPSELLTVTATSSNQQLLPDASILLAGAGAWRGVRVVPANNQTGTALVTMTVTDTGGLAASKTFEVQVVTGSPPAVSPIPPQEVKTGTSTTIIPFTVTDDLTESDALNVSVASSNTRVLPHANILLGGNGSDRTVALVPAAGTTGDVTVTLTVSDGTLASSQSFVLRVHSGVAAHDADFNGDGRADLVFQHQDGSVGAGFLQQDGTVSIELLNPSQLGDSRWSIVGSADFSSDGKSDLVFQHADGTLAAWFMDGINLTSAGLLNPSNPGGSWRVVGIGDFDKDGRSDLLFQDADGTLATWFMDGIDLLSTSLLTDADLDASSRVAGIGDYKGDGTPDVLVQHADDTMALLKLEGTKVISRNPINSTFPGWKVLGP